MRLPVIHVLARQQHSLAKLRPVIQEVAVYSLSGYNPPAPTCWFQADEISEIGDADVNGLTHKLPDTDRITTNWVPLRINGRPQNPFLHKGE